MGTTTGKDKKTEKVKLNGRRPLLLTEEKKRALVKILPLYEDFSTSCGEIGDCVPMKGIDYDDQVVMDKKVMSWYRTGNDFFPTKVPNQNEIPAGLYDINDSYEMGLYISRRNVLLDELFMLPDESMIEVVQDLEKFWAREAKYKEYGVTYKRGVLMYGPPGTGKTSNINLFIQKIIKDYNGIVLNVDRLSTFIPMVRIIRALEPTKPILAVIEDIDDFIYNNSTKDFLNVLDGNLQVNNIVYLASTNYIQNLQARIVNRPSRFDLIVEIDYPSDVTRRMYIEKKLKPDDLKKINVDKWVADTKGLTISHLKELLISVCIMENDYAYSLQRLKNMFSVED